MSLGSPNANVAVRAHRLKMAQSPVPDPCKLVSGVVGRDVAPFVGMRVRHIEGSKHAASQGLLGFVETIPGRGAMNATEKSVSVRWDADKSILRGPYYTGERVKDSGGLASAYDLAFDVGDIPVHHVEEQLSRVLNAAYHQATQIEAAHGKTEAGMQTRTGTAPCLPLVGNCCIASTNCEPSINTVAGSMCSSVSTIKMGIAKKKRLYNAVHMPLHESETDSK